MQVRVLIPHGNRFGDAFEKQTGASYDLPDSEADMLIRGGLVERVEAPKADPAPTKTKAAE